MANNQWDGSERRSLSERRTCQFHDGTCEDIKLLEKTMLPRWVFIWIGGPVIALLLGFGGWNALKSINNTERLIAVEISQEVFFENQKRLMAHFEIPVYPLPVKKSKK